MKRSLNLLLILISMVTELSAGSASSTFQFLRNEVSARSAALAGSFLAVQDDPNSLFYNAAALSTLEGPRGSIGFFKNLLDINTGYVSYSQELEGIGFFGVGVVYTNYGSFARTDDIGTELGTFGAGDIAVSVGYSNMIEENLYYGASVKFIYSSIESYSSSGIAADLGILYCVPASNLTLGASIRNIGGQLDAYVTTKEDLPLDAMVGASIVPRGIPLLLNLSFNRLNEGETFGDRFKDFSIGGEFTLSKVLQLRFGYDNDQRRDLKIGTSSGLAGFAAGIGIHISDYRVDYALSSLGKAGSVHRVSIGASL